MPVSVSTEPGLGIYIHWPFCAAICPYCDFNVRAARTVDEAPWRLGYARLLARYAAEIDRQPVTSVYFGGGTPSLMSPGLVATVLEAVAAHFVLAGGAEITLEANPSSATAPRLADFRAVGINRLSLGVQSFDDAALAFLGRDHTAAAARQALAAAQRVFPRTTFDLIYARPGQSLAAWRRELDEGLAFAATGGHLSLYQLGIEAGTPFAAAQARGEIAALDSDDQAAFYELTQERCEGAGLAAYEVSNHARPGEESVHNLVYWRYCTYLGVGPGAHGRLLRGGLRHATEEHRSPQQWLAAAADGEARSKTEVLAPAEQGEELLFMGLRLREGVSAARFLQVTGARLSDVLPPDRCDDWIAAGLVAYDGERLRLTDTGRPLLNTIYAKLIDRLSW
ncbi:MAG: coproporphyrinogen III oxidase [Alphaproteobacteria bacterium]|nr:coproporphyrinogen III oxidase [Alphaproteobacteria bacterium]